MKTDRCAAVQSGLGPFIDGELTGAERLRLSRHLETCRECAGELEELKAVGDALRARAAAEPSALDAPGFAAGIISRSRAEASLSWRGRLERACDDWHWFVVGTGSVAATFVSTLLLSAILTFGPAPERHDSLGGLITTLEASTGDEVVMQDGPDRLQQDLLLLTTSGQPDEVFWLRSPAVQNGRVSAVYRSGEEAELVGQLALVAAWDTQLAHLEAGASTRELQEAQEELLARITRLRLAEPVQVRQGSMRMPAGASVWR